MFSPRIFLHSVLELITDEVVQFYKAAASQQREGANDGLFVHQPNTTARFQKHSSSVRGKLLLKS